MTPPSMLAPGVALDQDLSLSRKRKRRAEPTENSRKKSCTRILKSEYISTTRRHASGFWDLLKEIHLTHQALKEFDRRDALIPRPVPPSSKPKRGEKHEKQLTSKASAHLRRFARTGGPDLTDIRGYRHPPLVAMAPKRKSTVHPPAKTKGGRGPSTSLLKGNFGVPSAGSENSDATTNAYTLNFQTILANHSITPPNPSKAPDNADEWRKRMKQERPNKKLENITTAQFLEFQNISQDSRIEDQVMRYIYPYFRESAEKDRLHSAQQNRPCKHWIPLIPQPAGDKKNPLVVPQPDLWDGLRKQKYKKLRKTLDGWIVPASKRSPSLSNFFGEFKSPGGTAACAIRQACYDGALGARGMHKAQNLGKEDGKEVYDNNAYTISFWYGSGFMNAHLHWLSPPKFPGDENPYNMYLVGQWALIADIEDFRKGITAFRNARDMAYELRVLFAKKATRKLDKTGILADNLNLGSQASSFDSSQNDDDDDSDDDDEVMNDSSDEDGPSEEEGPDSDDDGQGEEGGVDDDDDEDSEDEKYDEEEEEGTKTEDEDTETEHDNRKGKIGRRHAKAPQSFDGASSFDSNYTEDNGHPPHKRQRGSPVPSAPAPKSKPGSKAKAAEQATANAKSKKTPKGKSRAEDELDPKMAMLAKGYGSSQ